MIGHDLIEAGLKPNANFHILLEHAHKLRLAEVNKESALKEVMKLTKKIKEFKTE